MTHTFTDCIGFGGGFALGMTQAGLQLKAKREVIKFGIQTCESNRPVLGWDWNSQLVKLSRTPDWRIEKTDVVTGNPPCSGFSTMTMKQFRGTDAAVNDFMWAFAHYVAGAKPKIAAFESVQHAYKLGRPLMQDLRAKVEAETGLKYDLVHLMHNAASLGGAANRPRYFWVITRIPFGVEYPEPDLVPTFNESISDLEGLDLTWEKQAYKRPDTWWSHRRRAPDNAVDGHMTRQLSTWNRILEVFDALDGEWKQGWREEDALREVWQRKGSLPPAYKRREALLESRNFQLGVNQPMRWKDDRPCRVITGAALEAVIHPHENRLLSHREAARIQGFPDTWRVWPVRDYRTLGRTWGKGIPVDAGRWLGYWIKRALEEDPGTMRGTPVGDREALLEVDKGFKRAMARGARKHVFYAA